MSNEVSVIVTTKKSETTYYVVQGECIKHMWFDEGCQRATIEMAREDWKGLSKRLPSFKHRIMKRTKIEEVVK